MLNGESFGFVGFDYRRTSNRKRTEFFILMTPKKKARKAIKAKIRTIIANSGALTTQEITARINPVLSGWVNYFRVGNSNRAFSEVRDYLEMKIRSLLSRRKRRQKRSIGWQRWNNEYLIILGLEAETSQQRGCIQMKVNAITCETHKPCDESHWVSRLRENFTSGSDGEGLETDRKAPRQSFTRQVFFKEIKQTL
jgi:hypothetical protein